MIHYATLEQARETVASWNGSAQSVSHLGDFGNSVFEFSTINRPRQILRFTDSHYRTIREVEGEIEYLAHMQRLQAPSCYPIPAYTGTNTILVAGGPVDLIASSITFANGIVVSDSTPYWTKNFFREWGRNLAALHNTSRAFQGEKKRWIWDEEILFRDADQLIPEDDNDSRVILSELYSELAQLQKNQNTFGMIHGDHAPQNFHYDPVSERITAFDFGNCCYHWYLADVAIALSTVRFRSDRDQIKEGILDGYRETEVLPGDFEEQLELFMRLRIFYVYLDRLHLFGKNPTSEQQTTLDMLRKRVYSRNGWKIFSV